MGISTVALFFGKSIGYVRQLLIAYFFGISRALDVYFMSYSITMIIVFSTTTMFDMLATPRLIQTMEKEGEQAFNDFSGSLFTFSIVFAVAMSFVYMLLVHPVSWWLTRGFSPLEKLSLRHFTWFFIPWILFIFPYNCLTAILKSLRYFDVVILADFSISVLSTLAFAIWHSRLAFIPLTLSGAYAVVLGILIVYSRRKTSLVGPLSNPRLKIIYKNFSEMFIANSSGFLHQSVGRFFQSYLIPGSISAYSYVLQTISPIYEFLGFDDLYSVSLSSTEKRSEKLQRLLSGLLLLVIPVVIFIYFSSTPIIQILYQRGKFGPEATTLASRLLQIAAFGLIPGILSAPLSRVLHISDRVLLTWWFDFITAIVVLGMNILLVFKLHMDVIGVALATLSGGCALIVVEFIFLFWVGIKLQMFSLLKYAAWATFSGILCGTIVNLIPDQFPLLVNLGINALAFGGLLVLFFWPVRGNIKYILYGVRA